MLSKFMSQNNYDVIVIGAGIIGTSIAYQLCLRGIKDVLILEKGDQLGLGSTGNSSAVLRQRYTHIETCLLAKEGIDAYRSWSDFLKAPKAKSRMTPSGVLWMMQENLGQLRIEDERLRKIGIKTRVIDRKELQERFPAVSACQVPLDLTGEVEHACKDSEHFLLEEDGGFADPLAANLDLLRAGIAQGTQIELNKKVSQLLTKAGSITGLKTSDGQTYSSPCIVNAAGPWCNKINQLAGIKLKWDLRPTRIQVCVRNNPHPPESKIPVFADAAGGIYGRWEARAQQILYGSILPEDEEEYIDDPDNFNIHCDQDYRDTKLHAVNHRILNCEGRGDASGLAALYTVNREDMHPLLGESSLKGFYIANGLSGHGFKLAPSVGSLMAKIISHQSSEFDSKVDPLFLGLDRAPIPLKVKNVLA